MNTPTEKIAMVLDGHEKLVRMMSAAARTSADVLGELINQLEAMERRENDLLMQIEHLRLAIRRLADQDATMSVCNGNVTVEMDWTLTEEEREAVAYFAVIEGDKYLPAANMAAATLRNLLERHK